MSNAACLLYCVCESLCESLCVRVCVCVCVLGGDSICCGNSSDHVLVYWNKHSLQLQVLYR